MIEVLVLAAIALFVLSRLYVALGKDDGPPEGRPRVQPEPSEPEAPDVPVMTPQRGRQQEPVFTGPAAGGLEEIYRAESGFHPREFLQGARAAYEMIVDGFARGDREMLRPLLDDDVYEAWDTAIAAREASGEEPWRLLRLKRADIDSAGMDGEMARVWVRFEAELGDGEKVRTAREVWTFMRNVTSPDPNWLLDDVEIAS